VYQGLPGCLTAGRSVFHRKHAQYPGGGRAGEHNKLCLQPKLWEFLNGRLLGGKLGKPGGEGTMAFQPARARLRWNWAYLVGRVASSICFTLRKVGCLNRKRYWRGTLAESQEHNVGTKVQGTQAMGLTGWVQSRPACEGVRTQLELLLEDWGVQGQEPPSRKVIR